jgi:regulator of cell morphogenesis and NO signaling
VTDPAPIHNAAALTRHIETRYHARHRQQLPNLATLAEMIEDLHGPDRTVPEGLGHLLRRMIGVLEVHMKKEELMIFPLIRRGGRAPVGVQLGARIAAMRADHDDHDRDLATIRRLTGDLTLPAGACRSWVTLYEGLAEFTADLAEHMRLENDVLFPRFEKEAHADV